MFDRAKEDSKFNSFFEEIMNNYEQLVNTDYDPYKISFPAAYQHLETEDFEFEFEEVMRGISEQRERMEEGEEEGSDYETMFKEFEEKRSVF